MPPPKSRPSTAARKAEEALERITSPDKTPARRALDFLLEGSHDQPVTGEAEGLTSPHPLPPPTISYHPPPTSNADAAPKKDFARVANSVTRDAVPAGLFRGTSKKTYDALYLRTRGAIVPKREVRARMNELMTWCSVSHNTLREHLRHLEAVGLIRRKWELGNNDGARYEVFIPEELGPPTTTSPLLPPPTTSSSSQNVVGGSTQILAGGGGGQAAEDSVIYGQDKTLIKTNTENDDDEALAPLLAQIRRGVKEITGKEPPAGEAERWRELGELLVTELKIAAGRTNVSSVPAFLTEHLRRRLWKKERRQLDEEGKSAAGNNPSDGNVDVSKCPDCFGAGMWYPEGFDKGVARCRHEKLTAGEPKRAD